MRNIFWLGFVCAILVIIAVVFILPAKLTSGAAIVQTVTPSLTIPITPTITLTPTPLPTLGPKLTITQIPVDAGKTAGENFGIPGLIQCWNCSPFQSRVQVSSYTPEEGGDSCLIWSEKYHYCMSPTGSLIPWESVYGFGAACPMEWPIGTWVIIPGVGAYVCFDRGGSIKCTYGKDGLCKVDLLGPPGKWDQGIFEAMIWVPIKPNH